MYAWVLIDMNAAGICWRLERWIYIPKGNGQKRALPYLRILVSAVVLSVDRNEEVRSHVLLDVVGAGLGVELVNKSHALLL